ncbi:MAG TPA: hypothetical protein VN947_34265, partial [Polyangia bacterium]|nr:hypothetical protein [Polyangia bacterium]
SIGTFLPAANLSRMRADDVGFSRNIVRTLISIGAANTTDAVVRTTATLNTADRTRRVVIT